MKLRLSVGAAVLLFILQTSAFAITGQGVYDRYKQTENRMERSIKSLIMVVKMDTSGTIVETTIYKKGKKIRVEALVKKSNNPMMGKPGQKTISIDNGVNTTVFHPSMGKMTMPSEKAKEDNRRPSNVQYLGKENVSGIKCHKIKASFYGGESETLWISARDFVLVKENDGEGSSIVNSSFKRVGGFLMPYVTKTYEEGALESTSRVKSAKVGAWISSSKFNPAKVKGFKTTKNQGKQVNKAMSMMEMAMEIQRLHMSGETEKANALTKKMQQMANQ